MHETVSVDFVGGFREYELPFEFSHLSEKCHLNRKVNESHREYTLLTRRAVFPLAVGPVVQRGKRREKARREAHRTGDDGQLSVREDN